MHVEVHGGILELHGVVHEVHGGVQACKVTFCGA